MASGQQDYSDEYVANVLKRDAESSSIKYSAIGLQAFLPKRLVTVYYAQTRINMF